MTVESLTEDFAQRSKSIPTKFLSTRILTEDFPVRDRILTRAERAFGEEIMRRGVSDGFGLITWMPVFVSKMSAAEGKSLRMEKGLHDDCN